MANIPKKIAERISFGIKKFQPVLSIAKSRDVNESDMVIIITDMLSEIFGYDKYSEITSEFAVRSTFCDLAIKLDGKVQLLIEVKAIDLDLRDSYIKQAVDYAANLGVDFVILTNGLIWKAFNVSFEKPVDKELVFEIDFPGLSPKKIEDIEKLFLICKEGWVKSALYEFHSQKQVLSRFYLGSLILGKPIINMLRNELRRLSPDIKITPEQVYTVVFEEVLKREVVEGEKAEDAKKKITRVLNKSSKNKEIKSNGVALEKSSVGIEEIKSQINN